MAMCEECERKEAQVDAIADGVPKKMCSQCASLSGAIVIERPSQQKIDLSHYSRPKVKQVLSRMAGITKDNYSPDRPTATRNPYANLRIPASRKNVSLDDLREVKKSNEAEEKALNADVSEIEDVEAEVEQHKSKVSWFGRVANMFKKEKNPEKKEFCEVQPGESALGPAANMEDMPAARKVRVIDSGSN